MSHARSKRNEFPVFVEARWKAGLHVALEKTFALASENVSLRLLAAMVGGGRAGASAHPLPLGLQAAVLERCVELALRELSLESHGPPLQSLCACGAFTGWAKR